MLESRFEQNLVRTVKRYGGWALKLNAQQLSGIPDRLILLPATADNPAVAVFIELKSPTGRLAKIQEVRLKALAKMGFQGFVISEIEHFFHILLLNRRRLFEKDEKKYKKYTSFNKEGDIFVSELWKEGYINIR